ncbi:hypothetical protein KGY73_09475 [bacterium]|nr:hypothetical protein [bacterium]
MNRPQEIHRVRGKSFLFCAETSDNPQDYKKYEDLRNEIWAEPTDHLAGARNMLCENFFHEGTSLFIAVYTEDSGGNLKEDKDHFIGFSYGYVGVKNKEIGFRSPENLFLYSQFTGIKKGFRNYGLGVLIKEFQRKTLMDVWGIHTVTCTYDPLTGVNAYRNIHHFRMEVNEYREACYEEFGGNLNRVDVPCDRFYLIWNLLQQVSPPSYSLEKLVDSGCVALRSKLERVKGKNGPLSLEVVDEVNSNLESEFQLVEIPYDFYKMLRQTDVTDSKVREIPLRWRMETRKIFQRLFQKHYRVIDFRALQRNNRTRDFYVLKK